jgi:hypothetical protein
MIIFDFERTSTRDPSPSPRPNHHIVLEANQRGVDGLDAACCGILSDNLPTQFAHRGERALEGLCRTHAKHGGLDVRKRPALLLGDGRATVLRRVDRCGSEREDA